MNKHWHLWFLTICHIHLIMCVARGIYQPGFSWVLENGYPACRQLPILGALIQFACGYKAAKSRQLRFTVEAMEMKGHIHKPSKSCLTKSLIQTLLHPQKQSYMIKNILNWNMSPLGASKSTPLQTSPGLMHFTKPNVASRKSMQRSRGKDFSLPHFHQVERQNVAFK